jgi:dihydrolipoamide dehydrogenase
VEHEFDVVVIGAGPAGEVLAGRVADRSDRRVAIVERELVGGECAFYACMPSKALLRPAEALREARRIPGAAEAADELDVPAVLARRDEVISHLDDADHLPWIEERGIALFRGQARLDGERRVRVGDEVLVARDAVVLAVGSGPSFPPIPGLKEAGVWSNRQITTASRVPEGLLILGGGVVGVEMAQAWSSLGSAVTVIEAADRLLAQEEPFAGEIVADALREAGVVLHLGAEATAVEREGDAIRVSLESGETVIGQRLLVAVGRRPHTDGLGLETVGLPDADPIEVDDHLQVPGRPWLYAVGDVNGRALLTHAGKYQARIAADHILGEKASAVSDCPGPPRVIFTDPQVAAVGLTLAQAREQGLRAEAVDLDTEGTAGGSFYGRGAAGITRFVVDAEREVLVGATFTGPEIADFLQAATIAVVAQVPLARLAHAIAPFPTRSELWLKLIESCESELGRSLHGSGGPQRLR